MLKRGGYMDSHMLRTRIRFILIGFIAALVLAGITAIPLRWEIAILNSFFGEGSTFGAMIPALAHWIGLVAQAIDSVSRDYPFMNYGYDWLAFAHIVIAIAFIGPLRDPVRNIWVIEFGMIACALIVPAALFFGSLRGIPIFWQIVDCSFGVLGIVPLSIAREYTGRLVMKTEVVAT
jgi:hypothetical protein